MELNDILARMRSCPDCCFGQAVVLITGDGEIAKRCPDTDCEACRCEALRKLADEIEAAAFAGLPIDANGERLMLGDAVSTDGFGNGTVVAVTWKGSVCARPSDAPAGKGGVWMRAVETAHEPRPVSGDGVALEIGSRVWLDGAEHAVDRVRPTRAEVAGHWRDASGLMAEPPARARREGGAAMTNLEWWRANRLKDLFLFTADFDCATCPCFDTAFCTGEGVQGCIAALAKWAVAEHVEGGGDA